MKQEMGIVMASIFIITVVGFSLFYVSNNRLSNALGTNMDIGRGRITGFVVDNETVVEEIDEIIMRNITQEQASQVIEEAEEIIVWMKYNGFSVNYVGDVLIEAKRVFEQVVHAEILRDVNSSKFEKQIARKALSLVKWKDITYDNVLEYTEEIKVRKEQAILLKDKIAIGKHSLDLTEGELYSVGLFSGEEVETQEARELLEEVENAFENERFEEVEELLIKLESLLERERAKASGLASLKLGAMNFFQRYWYLVIMFLGIFGFGGFFGFKKVKLIKLKNRFQKMKVEKESLIDLMRKTQTERFKENKISELVYNIRINKYQQRINKISQILPVLESRLVKKKKEIKKV